MVEFRNCGVVKVKKGSLTIPELEQNLSGIFSKEWPWQIRELDDNKFLGRFPPQKKVEDLKVLPGIDLLKENTSIGVQEWKGDLDPFDELQSAWVVIMGIPPKWCTWKVMAQVVSCFGILTEVDWGTLFKTFYEEARVRVLCRDTNKIPEDRMVEMKHKLYKLQFAVEKSDTAKVSGPRGNDDGDDPGDDDEADDLDDEEAEGNKKMDTDKEGKTPEVKKDKTQNNVQKTGYGKTVNTGTSGEQEAQDGEEKPYVERVEIRELMTDTASTGEQHSRWEKLVNMGEQGSKIDCIKLLRDMELYDSDSEIDEVIEMDMLSDVAIQQLSGNLMGELNACSNQEIHGEEMKYKYSQKEEGKGKEEMPMDKGQKDQMKEGVRRPPQAPRKKNKWGPVLVEKRSKRVLNDGRTMLEKAQDLKKSKIMGTKKLGAIMDGDAETMEKDDGNAQDVEEDLQGGTGGAFRCGNYTAGGEIRGMPETTIFPESAK